jgi:hypothetical protein
MMTVGGGAIFRKTPETASRKRLGEMLPVTKENKPMKAMGADAFLFNAAQIEKAFADPDVQNAFLPFMMSAAKAVALFLSKPQRHALRIDNPENRESVGTIAPLMTKAVSAVGILADEVRENPRLLAYEKLLTEAGYNPMEARILSYGIVKMGAEYTIQLNRAKRDLHPILVGLRKTSVDDAPGISRWSGKLEAALQNPEAARLVGNALASSDSSYCPADIEAIAQDAQAGVVAAVARLKTIADSLIDHVPSSRGKPVATSNGTHAILLFILNRAGKRRSYTYRSKDNEFTDATTMATRRAFRQPQFNPRSSLKRLPDRVRKMKKPS